jgi:hypothetical protein
MIVIIQQIINLVIAKVMILSDIDNPFKCFNSYAPTPLMNITTDFYNVVEKERKKLLNLALNGDAFGSYDSYCYYDKLIMINTLYSIIYLIYMDKKAQLKLYNEGEISEVYSDVYYREKYNIASFIKPFYCINIDLRKVFDAVNFDGESYITGIGYMYISPTTNNPIFTIS